jgi:hypothetical protein
MNTGDAVRDNRTIFGIAMAALGGAISATVLWIWPDIPPHIVSLWFTAYMAFVRVGEVFYDHRRS